MKKETIIAAIFSAVILIGALAICANYLLH